MHRFQRLQSIGVFTLLDARSGETETHCRGGAWQKPGVLDTSGQRLVAAPLHPWGRGPLYVGREMSSG